jgi:glycosyltransferase involved in cell wall biosynthesis
MEPFVFEQITPLVLTYNEAPNIGRVLDRLAWAGRVVVVDSYSDDATEMIAKTYPNVAWIQRAFDCHANQWNFGLRETGIDTEWVLALDAVSYTHLRAHET